MNLYTYYDYNSFVLIGAYQCELRNVVVIVLYVDSECCNWWLTLRGAIVSRYDNQLQGGGGHSNNKIFITNELNVSIGIET